VRSPDGRSAPAQAGALPIVYEFAVAEAIGDFAPGARVRRLVEDFIRRKNAAADVTQREHLSVVLRTKTDWDASPWQRPTDLYIHGVDILGYVDHLDEKQQRRAGAPREAVCADLRELTQALGTPPPEITWPHPERPCP
jgi:hypothetical protein